MSPSDPSVISVLKYETKSFNCFSESFLCHSVSRELLLIFTKIRAEEQSQIILYHEFYSLAESTHEILTKYQIPVSRRLCKNNICYFILI
ncbi:MAG: hypothetical protein IPG78_18540 [Ignavibacteria bacterium]|nr:hypothetical protein [Ignavibacteria bacterium]